MDDAVESLSDELGAAALNQQVAAAAALARGDHSSATQIGIEALIATVKIYSPESEPTAVCLCTLGAALSAERPRLAECMLNAAVAILAGRNLPPDDLSAALQSNLSTVYRTTGRPKLAVTAASFCARTRERDSKTPPEKLALAFHNLGAAQLAAGHNKAAEQTLRKAMDLRTQLRLSDRAATASFLITSLIAKPRAAIEYGEAFLSSVKDDTSIAPAQLGDVHMSLADACLAAHRKSDALTALTQAHWHASKHDERLSEEVQARLRYVSDRKNWNLFGRFRGWGAAGKASNEEEDWIWHLFAEVSDYSRYFLSKALVAAASPSTRTFCGLAKRLDVATSGPFEQIDPRVLQAGLGPPTNEHDNIFIYVAPDGAFSAHWVPICPVNPLFAGFLNAIVAVTAYDLKAGTRSEDHEGRVKSWIELLRRLAAAAKPAQSVSGDPISDEVGKDPGEASESTVPQRLVSQTISYFPQMVDFEIRKREVEGDLVFSWLDNIRSAGAVGYEALLWIEQAPEVQIQFSLAGRSVGAPILVMSLERSHDRNYFLCAFTANDHRNLGTWPHQSAEICPLFFNEAKDLAKTLLAESRP
jgi:hypothetical protein